MSVSNLISKQTTTSIYLTTSLQDRKEAVVLKTIDKEKISESPLAIKFAQQESTVHSQMDHPNIIKVFHYAETEKYFCIYMEYAGFGSDYLSKRVLQRNKPVKGEKLRVWAQDILYAMSYMH